MAQWYVTRTVKFINLPLPNYYRQLKGKQLIMWCRRIQITLFDLNHYLLRVFSCYQWATRWLQQNFCSARWQQCDRSCLRVRHVGSCAERPWYIMALLWANRLAMAAWCCWEETIHQKEDAGGQSRGARREGTHVPDSSSLQNGSRGLWFEVIRQRIVL